MGEHFTGSCWCTLASYKRPPFVFKWEKIKLTRDFPQNVRIPLENGVAGGCFLSGSGVASNVFVFQFVSLQSDRLITGLEFTKLLV